MTLAEFLKQARERRGLNFRELESAADELDHAYIWRLEKGDRSKPSPATVEKLTKAFQLDERESEIFALLTKCEIDDTLYSIMMKQRDIDWQYLEPVATMSFRGKRPSSEDDWLRMIEHVKEFF
jgi:transcriptional regulator with XRE-family HTH domain